MGKEVGPTETSEYVKLRDAVERTELDLNHCDNSDYLPQKKRSHVWMLAEMGDYFYTQEHFTEALNYYTQAKRLDCDEPSVLNQIGVCLTFLGKIERGLYYFELLARRANSPEDKALAFFNCAHAHELLNNINDAIVALRKSIKHVPAEDAINKLDHLKEMNARRAVRSCMHGIFSRSSLPKNDIPTEDAEPTNGVTPQ